MKATDSGIKEGGTESAVNGQMEPTPRPWKLRMLAEGMEEAPTGLTAEQRKRWGELMSERNRPMRENDGSFIIIAGSSDERCRVATASSRVKAKRGMAHTVEDPEALANAELVCRAVNNFDALVEAISFLQSQVRQLAGHAFSEGVEEWLAKCDAMNCADRILAKIRNEQSILLLNPPPPP